MFQAPTRRSQGLLNAKKQKLVLENSRKSLRKNSGLPPVPEIFIEKKNSNFLHSNLSSH